MSWNHSYELKEHLNIFKTKANFLKTVNRVERSRDKQKQTPNLPSGINWKIVGDTG